MHSALRAVALCLFLCTLWSTRAACRELKSRALSALQAIVDKVNRLRNQLTEAFNNGVNAVGQKLADLKKSVDDTAGRVRGEIDRATNGAFSDAERRVRAALAQ